MNHLKNALTDKLETMFGVQNLPSPVAGGSSLFFNGIEFAHFHNDFELDLKLTRKIISQQQLRHPTNSKFHPKRSMNSQWIELKYENLEDVDRVVELVKLAIRQLPGSPPRTRK
ncbi:luciferase family protein [Gynuella sp.]|uniref:luciferase domain-containing protein n=1 Tax=Gynuella sp. TaxID=2969146 RepID=UPI003D0BE808